MNAKMTLPLLPTRIPQRRERAGDLRPAGRGPLLQREGDAALGAAAGGPLREDVPLRGQRRLQPRDAGAPHPRHPVPGGGARQERDHGHRRTLVRLTHIHIQSTVRFHRLFCSAGLPRWTGPTPRATPRCWCGRRSGRAGRSPGSTSAAARSGTASWRSTTGGRRRRAGRRAPRPPSSSSPTSGPSCPRAQSTSTPRPGNCLT